MREIKFRAWDGYTKKMVESHEPILFNKIIPLCFNNPNGGKFESSTGLSSYYLMQYTGLKDADGVEIYEGDIVSDHIGNGEVKYSKNKAAFKVDYNDGFAKWFLDYNLRGERESIKAIGNIYENPELLK